MASLAGRRFVNPATVETQVFDWGTIKWLSEPRVTGTERFTMGVVLLQPGKGHVRHNHPGTEEILYVVSGQGKQMIDIDGEQWEPIAAGDMIHIPADIFHSTVNTGWESLKLIAVYSPPGPEALLRAMAECRGNLREMRLRNVCARTPTDIAESDDQDFDPSPGKPRQGLLGDAIVRDQDIYFMGRANDRWAHHANLAGISNHHHLL
jgi:quercetin dioxygenase-like cupin family protein